jgi:carbon monoxide dehydrogenase subunit G
MELSVELPINAGKDAIWDSITNLEDAPSVINGIDSVEILEKPEQGIVGLKWRETRTLFGKQAAETMWITDAVDEEYYKTRAESHGSIYISEMGIKDGDNSPILYFSFKGEAQTFGAKIMSRLMGGMMKKSMTKTMMKDLEDIKNHLEK